MTERGRWQSTMRRRIGVAVAMSLACVLAAGTIILPAALAAAPARTSSAGSASALRARIVRTATHEIGYSEPGNYCTKFGPCEAWCSLFVTWVWRHAGVAIPRLPFTGNLYQWAKARNAALGPRGRPAPGDAVLFGTGPWTIHSSLHVGIVQAVYPHYLVTIEGDSAHAVRRYVVPLGDPLRAGEPGPIYAYASPLSRPRRQSYIDSPAALAGAAAFAVATVVTAADTIAQAPATNQRLARAAEFEGTRLLATIRALGAFQHMPFHTSYLQIDWTGLDRLGRVRVSVDARLSPAYAGLAWQRFLHRFGDPGTAYVVSYRSGSGVPVAFSPPSITGRAKQGQTLSLGHGNWANLPGGYRWQWEDCDRTGRTCIPIAGATGSSYRLSAADVGHRIRVVETAVNGFGTGAPAASLPTRAVAIRPEPKPTPTPKPKPKPPATKPAAGPRRVTAKKHPCRTRPRPRTCRAA